MITDKSKKEDTADSKNKNFVSIYHQMMGKDDQEKL
jgi:hypothetical protein